MLLRAVGLEDELRPDLTEVGLGPGDALALVSDGCSDVVAAEVIGRLVNDAPTALAAAERLVSEAIDRCTTDNVTAIVLRHVPSSSREGRAI
ncbi:MAG: hypothetical protein HYX32_10635 [Actinobacteria bacterium]|nr:hypothetical protein [Actinomycetota bacterium]